MKGEKKYLIKAREIAMSAGLPVSVSGFHYFCDAIRIILEDGGYSYLYSKEIYNRVAEKNGVNENCVHKAMEYALKNAWTKNHETFARWVDEQSKGQIRKKPTNIQFICLLYYSLEVENAKTF